MRKNWKYYILTFGCQMNKNDSERLAGVLEECGLSEATKPENADVLFVNTCSVRQSAEDRVFGMLRNWNKLRKSKQDLIIGVTGCLPGRDKDSRLRKKLKAVDLFFPIIELPLLPERLRGLRPGWFGGRDALLGRDALQYVSTAGDYWQFAPKRQQNFSASVTIQNGCNNFCSYCVVPYARGREKNRPVKDILDEIRELAASGCKGITLLGQVVNNYQVSGSKNFSKKNPFLVKGSFAPAGAQDDNWRQANCHFAALLWEVNQITGIERVHFTAADPQYFNDCQIQALALPKQVNYLHLPVQSGDNEILKKMNRKYTREYYLDLIERIKKARSGIALGTDIIVGFCGETSAQFQNTVDLYRECDFDIAYLAKYSERSDTLAAKMFKDDVSKAEKKRRWKILQDLMEKTAKRKNQKYVGRKISVLVDNWKDGWCSGNSSEMKLVRFRGEKKMIGTIAEVEIEKALEWVLRGKNTKY